jgi:hypothetical protein
MPKRNQTTCLSQQHGERLKSAVGELVLAMTNNAALIKAGSDLAMQKPDEAKRYDHRVRAAHNKVKPELVRFVAELEDVIGQRMPWAFLGCKSREEAMALLTPQENENHL